eukprot:6207104-Pleurochrysis_carterae.AAC.1
MQWARETQHKGAAAAALAFSLPILAVMGITASSDRIPKCIIWTLPNPPLNSRPESDRTTIVCSASAATDCAAYRSQNGFIDDADHTFASHSLKSMETQRRCSFRVQACTQMYAGQQLARYNRDTTIRARMRRQTAAGPPYRLAAATCAGIF